jgi:hypothetical protein
MGALQRRFVFENPTLKAAPAEEEAPDSDIEYDEAEETRPRKKPKKTPAKKAGKIAKGENFWGRVDEWFKSEVAERGSSLTGPKWKRYEFAAEDLQCPTDLGFFAVMSTSSSSMTKVNSRGWRRGLPL